MYVLTNVEWPCFSGSEVEGILEGKTSKVLTSSWEVILLGGFSCFSTACPAWRQVAETELGSKQQNAPLPKLSTGKFAV